MILSSLLLPALALAPPPPHPAAQDPGSAAPHDATLQANAAHWQEAARALRVKHGVAQALPADEDAHRIRLKLEEASLRGLRLEEVESLEDALAPVAALTAVPIVVDPRAAEAMLDEGVLIDVDWPHAISASAALDLLTELAGDAVTWTVQGDVVLVATREALRAERLVHLHPIGDLLRLFDLDEIVGTVFETVASDSWEDEGIFLEASGGFLVVTQARDAQLEIERHLDHLRAFQASLDAPPTFEPTRAERAHEAALTALDGVRLSADFSGSGEGVPLDEGVAFLQQVSGLNFVVEHSVYDELDPYETRLDFDLGEVTVRQALDRITLERPELAWAFEDGIVRLRARGAGGGAPFFAVYDVRAITGPVGPPFAPLEQGRVSDEMSPRVLDGDVLEELIRYTIDPDSWDEDPRHTLRLGDDGVLWVNQSPRALAELRGLLQRLQGIADTLLEVEARRR